MGGFGCTLEIGGAGGEPPAIGRTGDRQGSGALEEAEGRERQRARMASIAESEEEMLEGEVKVVTKAD